MIDYEQFMKDMKDQGVDFVKISEVEGECGLSVTIDLDTDVDYSSLCQQLKEQDYMMVKKTNRKDIFYMAVQKYDLEKKRLTFMVACPLPKNIFEDIKITPSTLVGTTFPDLCWYHAEGTTPQTVLEVMTKFREEAKYGDLTYYLPSRFLDNFIEIMHTLNHGLLEGNLQDAIIYGPEYKS